MKIEVTFLRSKVARRIFTLFILCALLPIVLLAIISFTIVTKQLSGQSQERLEQASKNMGQDIIARFWSLNAEMEMAAPSLSAAPGATLNIPSPEIETHLKERFKGLALINDKGEHIPLYGRLHDMPELTQEDRQHILSSKRAYISTEYDPDTLSSRIFIGISLDGEQPNKRIFLAEIAPEYLWLMGTKDHLPAATELCILDQSKNVLYSSLEAPVSFPEQALIKMRDKTTNKGQFEWIHEEEKYLAGYWNIFLQSMFDAQNLTVVLSESKTHVLKPMAYFKKLFPFVVLLSLWVVLILSSIQIRRSMVPLEKLKEGTKRIARREFDSRVKVTSRDEFEDLAASFNTMANQLGRQFKTLTTIAEIDRAVLSILDIGKIVDTVLNRMPEVFPCHSVSMVLFDSSSMGAAQSYIGGFKSHEGRQVEMIEITPEEVEKLRNNPKTLLVEADEKPLSYLVPLAKHGLKSFLVLPIFLREELSGIITLGYLEPPEITQEDLDQARQLADQVAVAMSNAKLIEELSELNWGTLRALARAIDAKSPWTAGHSERSTKLALQIGQALGLSQEEIDNLHRGGLLHDIGKLGIPPDVLDKSEELTAEEFVLMRKHCRLGARILEPIAAYAEVIPIVEQHHEHFDGNGYPDGLAREDISLGARIFAVADRFEALTSERPYRKALTAAQAIRYIKQRAGSEFDPKVVKAFLEVMNQKERVKWSKR